MKKLIVCLIGLAILSGMAMGEEKFQFKLKYDRVTRNMKLVANPVITRDSHNIYWSQFELTGFKNRETAKRLYAEISWQIVSPLTIKSIIGVGTTGINTTPEIIDSAGYGTIYQWKREEPLEMDPVKGQSRMGFVYGLGAEVKIYSSKTLEVKADAHFIAQEETPTQVNIFQMETYSFGWASAQAILQKSEIQKVKSQEIEIALALVKKVNKLVFSGGPILCWANTTYTGRGVVEAHFASFGFSGFNYHHRTKITDFEFETKSEKLFGVFARIGYTPTENSEIFVRFSTGAKKALGGGISINL